MLHYELEMRRLQVAQKLLEKAPRPLLVNSKGEESSALSTLLLAQILPDIMKPNGAQSSQQDEIASYRSIIQPLPEE